jgi:hypothetical protein
MAFNYPNPNQCTNCGAGNPVTDSDGVRFDCQSVWLTDENSWEYSIPCEMLRERNQALASVRGAAAKFGRRERNKTGVDPAQEAQGHIERIVNKVIGPPSILR